LDILDNQAAQLTRVKWVAATIQTINVEPDSQFPQLRFSRKQNLATSLYLNAAIFQFSNGCALIGDFLYRLDI